MCGRGGIGEVIALGLMYVSYKRLRIADSKKRRRSCWVKRWLLNREEKSAYSNIFTELYLTDQEEFRKYLRINTVTYTVMIYPSKNQTNVTL